MKNQGHKDIGRIVREDRKVVDDVMVKGVRDAVLRYTREAGRS